MSHLAGEVCCGAGCDGYRTWCSIQRKFLICKEHTTDLSVGQAEKTAVCRRGHIKH